MRIDILVRALVCLALAAHAALSAAADEILLQNGDRLSGDIVMKSGDKLVLRTDYAGEISVRWARVKSIRTGTPVRALVSQGADPAESAVPQRATLTPLADGRIEYVPADGGPARAVELRQIEYLNPKPYETAQGIDYKGRALFSAAATTGNVDSERLYGEGEFTARAQQYRYALKGRIEHREEAVVGTTASNWLLGANYDRFIDPKHFRYVRGSLENDRIKDISRRSALGGGYGLQFIETERANVALRGGLDYVVMDRIAGPDERYPALGWGLNVKVKPGAAGNLEVFHDQEGFWNLRDTRSVTLRSKTGLRMPLIAKINGVAQLNVDWESRPAPGREPVDTTLLLGVDYAW
jgi:putative salt-induced outer membrane protein YdiY